MLKLTKTAVGLLTKQYRSVLMKCWSINIGLFTITSVLATMASNEAISEIVYSENADRAGITLKTESTFHVGEGGNGFLVYNIDQESTNNTVAWLYNDWTGGGRLDLYNTERTVKTYLSYNRFQLNNSSVVADGITASVIQNSRNLITSGGVYDALNYYYTKTEADGRYLINNSSADGSIATGWSSSATGIYSVAIGPYSSVLSENSVAIGTWSYVSEDALWSVALGRSSAATEEKVFSIGDSDHNLFRRIVNVAEGSGAHDAVTVSQLGNIAAGTKILNANGESAITFGTGSGQTTVGTAISTLANQLYNYYYTKTEADARYALLDTIGDVDYSDEAADEGSALKNGAENSPTTVRGALDLLDTKIGSLNETGIAGDDVATQLKYILENGSTGGTGVSLSTLGYIGANTPYLNTTSNAMNFSSTYTIGGNMSTLANQIKTNENSISALNTRVNNLGTYGGTLELTDNYGKIMGDVSVLRNGTELSTGGNVIKAYASEQDVNLKSYTVELKTDFPTSGTAERYFRVPVEASSEERAISQAINKVQGGWVQSGDVFYNKYMYGTKSHDSAVPAYSQGWVNRMNTNITQNEASVTENNYKVSYSSTINEYSRNYDIYVKADNPTEAIEKADQILQESWYDTGAIYNNMLKIYTNLYYDLNVTENNLSDFKQATLSTSEYTSASGTTVADGAFGSENVLALGNGTVIENIALLDSAIGDLSVTGVSGASVAAQLQLLGEVGSEALGQKIGSWNTTKDSISQTLGEETKNYGYLTAFEYDSENEQYVGTVGDNLTALDTALSLTAKDLDALSHQLYNYYYTRTEADARYALLDTIGDVDYSDEAADEGSALKNGAEDSPTTVRGALDLLDTKIGSLNETGIAGDDVATQLKYILENGSTGGAGVTLSTLGYIGANTPYLNTTNEAMNFSSTYTIGGNMATLANQIKTNENSISALNTRVNNLGTYGGTLELTDNYGKIMGDVSTVRNGEQLGAATINVKPYATLQDVNLKSYTVEIATNGGVSTKTREFRIQVQATSVEEAEAKAKAGIAAGWSGQTIDGRYENKYMYATNGGDPLGVSSIESKNAWNEYVNAADATVTENNYTVQFHVLNSSNGSSYFNYSINVNATNSNDAVTKAKETISQSWYKDGITSGGTSYYNLYSSSGITYSPNGRNIDLTSADPTSNTPITDGSLGTAETYVLGNGTVIENIALLDSAIGDLGATGVSGASVAAQLKLLGEVGSEALGQKIGSWSTTKNSISQTFGEETKNYGYLTAFDYDSENEQYVGTVGDNLQALDSALSLTAKGLDALSHQLYNYYYTKTEADAEYALLEAAIGDVDDKVEDVDDKVDAVEAKIGSLNETGIAGNDVATQLKYILENGSTGGAGVTLSTLGYIGANTPYLNTTNEAMNFSSTYTIGGNMSTLANQIKTNETNIDSLSARVNSLATYNAGSVSLTDNYAKVIGDVTGTNHSALITSGTNVDAYATAEANKSWTVEIDTGPMTSQGNANRLFRVQVDAPTKVDAITKAKEIIVNSWSDYTVTQNGLDRNINKYMYGTTGVSYALGAYGIGDQEIINKAVMSAEATATSNNWHVSFTYAPTANNEYDFEVDVVADSEDEAFTKAKQAVAIGWYRKADSSDGSADYRNIYASNETASTGNPSARNNEINASITSNAAIKTSIAGDGDIGYTYNFGEGTIIENIALLDQAIGDLGTTGVSGASVAAQLKLLGEVGSEALGQKIGSWSTTKNSISQTLGEETKRYGYLTAFEYDDVQEKYVGTVGDNLQALDSALSLTAKGLDSLSNQLYNYYYTFRVDERDEVIEFALFLDNEKLSSVFEA